MNLKIEICKLQIKESHARRKWVVAHPSKRYAPPPITPIPSGTPIAHKFAMGNPSVPPTISDEIEGADEPRLRCPKKSARHCRDCA